MDFLDNIFDFFSKIPSLDVNAFDVVDILLVAFVIYHGMKLIRETRAFQLVKGLMLLGVVYFLVYIFQMQASTYILRYLFQNIFIILVVVFQQEIRQIIEKVGKSANSIRQLVKSSDDADNESVKNAITEISNAVASMSESKTGALIVMEHETLLGDVIKTGTQIDAEISHELIGNIFYCGSPLHDGAAVVRHGRLLCAGCVLPLTKNQDISSALGTRHRAALGMSEQCDAMVIVVSEETGQISIAKKGKLTRDYTEDTLREALLGYYMPDDAGSSGSPISLKKLFGGKNK